MRSSCVGITLWFSWLQRFRSQCNHLSSRSIQVLARLPIPPQNIQLPQATSATQDIQTSGTIAKSVVLQWISATPFGKVASTGTSFGTSGGCLHKKRSNQQQLNPIGSKPIIPANSRESSVGRVLKAMAADLWRSAPYT